MKRQEPSTPRPWPSAGTWLNDAAHENDLERVKRVLGRVEKPSRDVSSLPRLQLFTLLRRSIAVVHMLDVPFAAVIHSALDRGFREPNPVFDVRSGSQPFLQPRLARELAKRPDHRSALSRFGTHFINHAGTLSKSEIEGVMAEGCYQAIAEDGEWWYSLRILIRAEQSRRLGERQDGTEQVELEQDTFLKNLVDEVEQGVWHKTRMADVMLRKLAGKIATDAPGVVATISDDAADLLFAYGKDDPTVKAIQDVLLSTGDENAWYDDRLIDLDTSTSPAGIRLRPELFAQQVPGQPAGFTVQKIIDTETKVQLMLGGQSFYRCPFAVTGGMSTLSELMGFGVAHPQILNRYAVELAGAPLESTLTVSPVTESPSDHFTP